MYKIIIADDESTMRTALQTLIDWAALDCEIIFSAQDGQSVLEYFNVCKPDIIISDIKMPRMGGLELAKHLHKTEPQIKLILLTAFADFSYAQQAVSLNVVEYVIKSGALNTIVSAVEKCKRQLESTEKETLSHTPETNSLLKAMMRGVTIDAKEMLVVENQLAFTEGALFVLFIRYSPVTSNMGTLSPSRATHLLQDILQNNICLQFPFDANSHCFLVRGQSQPELLIACRHAVATFVRFTGEKFYVGISNACTSVRQLTEAATQCTAALEDSFYDAARCVNLFTPRVQNEWSVTALFAEKIAQLSEAVHSGAALQARKLLEQLFAEQKKSHLEKSEMQRQSMQIIELCKRWVIASKEDWPSICAQTQWQPKIEKAYFFTDYCSVLHKVVEISCEHICAALQTQGDAVLRTLAYIEANFQNDLSLSEIADALNINSSYLSRIFKVKTGMSFVDTITRKRMDAAKKMLEQGSLQIQEIALAVGMENATYFSHVFRKYVGLSPKAYQERMSTHFIVNT